MPLCLQQSEGYPGQWLPVSHCIAMPITPTVSCTSDVLNYMLTAPVGAVAASFTCSPQLHVYTLLVHQITAPLAVPMSLLMTFFMRLS